MALADISTGGQGRRLDSWKDIAEYLGRDVRTATRWESQGMPVHRVPGGKGTSVFALTSEIDAWMAGQRPDSAPPPVPPSPAPSLPAALAAPHVPALSRGRRRVRIGIAAGLTVALAGAAGGARIWTARNTAALHVTATETQVSVTDASGVPRVIHTFDPGGAVLVDTRPSGLADLDGDGEVEILIGVSFYEVAATRSTGSGELLALSAAGEVRWRFEFDDVLSFRDGKVSGPWALSDFQAGPALPAKVAVAAHHYHWWGSMVAILDHDGRRLGAFVNPGWIDSVLWLGTDRLAIAGFTNARNEAMIALLDPAAADGQAPGTADTPFACLSCASTPPLFYATLPRSEVNQVTGARFNRAKVALVGDLVTVSTVEIQDSIATAMYEFDRDFRLLRARYSEGYWDAHRRLEIEGRLTHSRANCPDREGPPAIHVWSGSDWTRTVPPR